MATYPWWATGGNVIDDDVPSPHDPNGSLYGVAPSWPGLTRNEVKAMMTPLRQRLAREKPCVPGDFGGNHSWEHVMGSDALEKCLRCGWVIGK